MGLPGSASFLQIAVSAANVKSQTLSIVDALRQHQKSISCKTNSELLWPSWPAIDSVSVEREIRVQVNPSSMTL